MDGETCLRPSDVPKENHRLISWAPAWVGISRPAGESKAATKKRTAGTIAMPAPAHQDNPIRKQVPHERGCYSTRPFAAQRRPPATSPLKLQMRSTTLRGTTATSLIRRPQRDPDTAPG